MKTKKSPLLQGKWVLTRKQFLNHKNKWTTEKRFPFGERIWSFNRNDGDRYHRGILEVSGSGSNGCSRRYFIRNTELHIERPENSDDCRFTDPEDVYRIDAGKNKLILDDIPQTDDPEYVCRFVLKKDHRFNRLIERFFAAYGPIQKKRPKKK